MIVFFLSLKYQCKEYVYLSCVPGHEIFIAKKSVLENLRRHKWKIKRAEKKKSIYSKSVTKQFVEVIKVSKGIPNFQSI